MEKHIDVSIKAPYYTLNKLTEKTETIWLVCHGSGQLAQYFMKKFEGLDKETNFIIAPQGLSKFYLGENNFTGRVGATWMTKEDRLTEIDNQQIMLNAIWENEVGEIGNKKIIFFGFSQGTNTISRFAAFSKIRFDKLILWVGGFPPDIPSGSFDHLVGEEEVQFFIGNEDPFVKPEMLDEQSELVSTSMGIAPELTMFDGGHVVMPELLEGI
ncbi:MAG: alpha/beta hydrolase [Cytophagales bacterium]|nr:alpha/beta hydrolase [Cytophagales bacterium]